MGSKQIEKLDEQPSKIEEVDPKKKYEGMDLKKPGSPIETPFKYGDSRIKNE
jgi:hypothetical protein